MSQKWKKCEISVSGYLYDLLHMCHNALLTPSNYLLMGRGPFFGAYRVSGLFFGADQVLGKKDLLGSCSGPKNFAGVQFWSSFPPQYHTNLS